MGIPLDKIESSIRISWGADTDIDAVKESFAKILMVAKGLASFGKVRLYYCQAQHLQAIMRGRVDNGHTRIFGEICSQSAG